MPICEYCGKETDDVSLMCNDCYHDQLATYEDEPYDWDEPDYQEEDDDLDLEDHEEEKRKRIFESQEY